VNWRGAINALLSREKPGQTGTWFFPQTQAGQRVDEDSALRYSAVWGCVRVISETMATLPWQVFQRVGNGRKELDSDIAWMLQVQPNTEMTPFVFKELMTRRVLLCGNAYAEIERDGGGRAVALWPIQSDRVCVERDEDGRIVYYVQDIEQGRVELAPSNMFHMKGPGGDGLVGYSVIRMAAESIGLGMAMQQFGANFFGNGAHVGGALFHPKSLSDTARKNLEQSVQRSTGGKSALSLRVFEEGMKYERIGIPPEDAQFLESRNAQVRDICRWYRVPPHKVGDLADAKWANIENQAIDFVTDAIVPMACRMEQEANAKLFGRNNRGTVYTKLNLAGLLRGDMKARYESYAVGRQWGWFSANDVLALEDLNPIKDGDLYLVPSNMTTPELLKKGPQKPAEPPPNETAPTQNEPTPPPNRAKAQRFAKLFNGAGNG
jgi:HK97 family phage portal protein